MPLAEMKRVDEKAKASLDEASLLCAELEQSLPSLVPAAGLTLNSKLPFKATSIRELLIHRMSDLSSAALEHFKSGRVVPGSLLARAAVETLAVLYCLNQSLERFLATPDVDQVNTFLMSSLVGARWDDHPVQSINVLTLIDKVEKALPGFRGSYDNLSEYAHPNWSGLLGSYGHINKEEHELHLGQRDNVVGLRAGAFVLATTLHTFKHYYNQSATTLAQFNEYFERQEPTGGT